MSHDKPNLENIRTTYKGEVVIVKRPKDVNVKTFNVSLTFDEYEYLVNNRVDRFEVLGHGRMSRKVEWNQDFLQYAQFHGVYYLVPYSKKSGLCRKKVGA